MGPKFDPKKDLFQPKMVRTLRQINESLNGHEQKVGSSNLSGRTILIKHLHEKIPTSVLNPLGPQFVLHEKSEPDTLSPQPSQSSQ
jgi:hypothetical protein